MCDLPVWGGNWGISSRLLILGAPNTKVFGETTTIIVVHLLLYYFGRRTWKVSVCQVQRKSDNIAISKSMYKWLQINKVLKNFSKPCSRDQDRSSFHGLGSGSYLNSAPYRRIFSEQLLTWQFALLTPVSGRDTSRLHPLNWHTLQIVVGFLKQ